LSIEVIQERYEKKLNRTHINLRTYVFALLQRPLTNYASYWPFQLYPYYWDIIRFKPIPTSVKADFSCQYSQKS